MSEDIEKNQPLNPNELVTAVEPHTTHLEKVGELLDNDTVTDKQAKCLQNPVLSAASVVVKLKLKRDAYRAKWRYKNTRRADKWANKDKVREQRKNRREFLKERRAVEKAAKREQKAAKKAARERTEENQSALESLKKHSRE